jgi:LysM repeat protein
MNNQNMMFHIIAPGDSLYSIARKYNTTVDIIMDANPYLNPQRLRIGDQIVLYTRGQGDELKITKEALLLMTNMRFLIDNFIIWNHNYITSATNNLMDIASIDQRQLKNIDGLGNAFGKYYGSEFDDKLTGLLKQHNLYINELIKAMIRNDYNGINNYERRLKTNNDDIAFALDQVNPYYNENAILNHLNFEVESIKNTTRAILSRDHMTGITVFDNLREQGIIFADYLTDGIIDQFPNLFNK